MTRLFNTGLVALATLILAHTASAHCQIPCGIYGDEARFTEIREHITTIEKSMKLIGDLSADPAANQNQLVRWVGNKEAHADAIAGIVTQYFLQQRIKVPAGEDAAYAKKLGLLHQLLVSSMKAKQTTDPKHAESLRSALDAFESIYFGRAAKAEGSGK